MIDFDFEVSTLASFEKDTFSVRPSLGWSSSNEGHAVDGGSPRCVTGSLSHFLIAAADLSALVRLCRSLSERLEIRWRFAR